MSAKVHFIGIGGAGMSGIARLLLARGVSVSGSDARESHVLAELRRAGAEVWVGQDGSKLRDAAGAEGLGEYTVVRSTAIRADNAELLAAQQAGARILHRSEALALAMGADRVLAVAGTHGKTTTTAMLAVALRAAGVNASYAIGAEVPELGANAALGEDTVFAAEADESDGSFLNYRPEVAVVTNVEPDHLDFYGSAEAVHRSFQQFVSLLPPHGALVICADDPGAAALADWFMQEGGTGGRLSGARLWRYGRFEDADFRLLGQARELRVESSLWAEPVALPLMAPGEHNALNAAAALAAAAAMLSAAEAQQLSPVSDWPQRAAEALASFRGAARRFEFRGEHGGVQVYDDYAHHPTEVRAALAAARSLLSAPQGRVLVLFQPHLFSRTREFASDFAETLTAADQSWVLDIYPAREEPIPGVTSELITKAAAPSTEANVGTLILAADPQRAVAEIAAAAQPGDLVLTVGAGSVTEQAGEILQVLMNRASLPPGEPGRPS
ncbi:UDP-N-acetylmuramate--L-alanine ligase [Acaricomes phytoseiuli]|uniref:UDP-N-acetylmuramate--L-alanine ligase n=1 Tax=Acaricomes phytoseiuli TaxID=291968 RepID=UPI0022226B61|nr:UDP-N-acetylmuramate--L-alanine ligase [Acaricomes phytoseiuli]MCW1249552.1 UDP-N-acetylmuramate--L-alanine ligase [Acaricomes phytoseiuli]